MLVMDARAAKACAKQVKNIKRLRALFDQAENGTPRSGFSLATRVNALDFNTSTDHVLEFVFPEEGGSLAGCTLENKPVEDGIAALRTFENSIRDGIEPHCLPRGRAGIREPRAARPPRMAKAVKAKEKLQPVRRAEPESDLLAPWDPRELEQIIEQHLDCRIRVAGPCEETAPAAHSEFKIKFHSPLPYDHPKLSLWIDGCYPDHATRVMVIREYVPQAMPSGSTTVSPIRPKAENNVCTSRMPLTMPLLAMVQDYVGLRAFWPGEKKLALTYETYLHGKPERAATRVIITRGSQRTTIRVKIRELEWLRAAHGPEAHAIIRAAQRAAKAAGTPAPAAGRLLQPPAVRTQKRVKRLPGAVPPMCVFKKAA